MTGRAVMRAVAFELVHHHVFGLSDLDAHECLSAQGGVQTLSPPQPLQFNWIAWDTPLAIVALAFLT